jgi:hypothetical protein
VEQPESDYGIAVYDVAPGAFSRSMTLAGPWFGVAELYALPNRRFVSHAMHAFSTPDRQALQFWSIGGGHHHLRCKGSSTKDRDDAVHQDDRIVLARGDRTR